MGMPSIVSAATSDCTLLARNLRVGMTGEDVRMLQVLLNSATSSRIATEGAGSPGNETTYFGNKTKAALVAFQEMYPTEVLTPAGLTRGSGFFGVLTRGKIVALCNIAKETPVVSTKPSATTTVPVISPTTPVAPVATTTPVVSTTTTVSMPELSPVQSIASATPALLLSSGISMYKSDKPVIMFPSKYAAPRGAKIILSSVGFPSSGNTVHLGPVTTEATMSSTGVLSFVIPENAPLGKNELWVAATNGTSNKTFLVVTAPDAVAPKILAFTPTEGFEKTLVTVTGTGFTPTGNEVRYSGGVASDLSSADGTTLQFEVTLPLRKLQPGQDKPNIDQREPIGFRIINANGISNSKVFSFKI